MKQLLIFLLILCLVPITSAQTVIYDNLTVSNYKTIQITDDMNYKILTDYKYDVYINNSYLGSYTKDEKIFIPDNSNITIYIPSPIKTDLGSFWNIVKSNGIIIISFLFTFIIVIVIIVKVYKKLR
jgi:ABC-type antimicrobial peptide transport system permease subunit